MRNLIAGLLLACAAPPAWGVGQDAKALVTLKPGMEQLRPGQFVWSPDLAPSGPMTIVVDLVAQRAHVYRNGVQIGFTTISSGRRGYETPTGTFTILQKAREHRSRKYDDAPMPYMQRLTWSGIALHGGHVRGHPASHGCVRLPMDFSKLLFNETRPGTTVIITEGSPSAEAIAEQSPENADLRGQSELPTDPVTILVNLASRQMLILRDGTLIGRSQVEIPGGVTNDPRALQISAASGESQSFHVGLVNQDAGRGQLPNAGKTMQLRVPPDFLAKMRGVITPGATILIAEDAIIGGDMPLTVMVSG